MTFLQKTIDCAALLILALCRILPGFARFWQAFCARPYAAAVSSLARRIPFPLIEALALGLFGALCSRIFIGIVQTVRTKCLAPLVRGIRFVLRGVLHSTVIVLLVWFPLYFADASPQPSVSAEQTEALCRALIDALNAAELSFSSSEDALRMAERAVNLPEGSVKAARYPEWMDFFHLSGFYSPWTGEALVHPDLAAAAMPFVACHELMHRLGVADEGQANIAAWQSCMSHGGEAANSARLWALRCAMTMLHETNESAWRACIQSMHAPVANAFQSLNGFSPTFNAQPASLLGMFLPSAANYDALVSWLVAFYEF